MANQEESKLEQAKRVLAAQGVKPVDYKHLPYAEILKLAGIKS